MSLELALKIAEANPVLHLPKMAAVLMYKRKVISIGLNQYRTHPMQKKYRRNDHSLHLHAEIDALRNALRNFSKEELSSFKMYIARVRKDGLTGLAAPCEGCKKALEDHGIKSIYWTDDPVSSLKKEVRN
jgi:deoxycytidylate deaminase